MSQYQLLWGSPVVPMLWGVWLGLSSGRSLEDHALFPACGGGGAVGLQGTSDLCLEGREPLTLLHPAGG